MTEPRSFVYGLVGVDGLVFYVGQTTVGTRRPRSHAKNGGRGSDRDHDPPFPSYEIVVLEVVADPDAHASWMAWWNNDRHPTALHEAERWWIAYGRASGWPLRNLSEGGERGSIQPSTCAKLAIAARRQWATPETRIKIQTAARRGRSTPDVRRKQSESARRHMSTPEARARLVGENNPSKRPDTRARLALAARRQWSTPEMRAKMPSRCASARACAGSCAM